MIFLEETLFKTSAIKVSAAYTPFWYTSGTIGPYFINTHFLYGGENAANDLLKFIDENLNEPIPFVNKLTERVLDFYKSNSLYKQIVDDFYGMIKDNPNFIESQFISGGERRDWFFSITIAHLSQKEHLFIFKNLDICNLKEKITNINNARISHIADLITQASSYERAWIPAIKNINGNFVFSASVVDRAQGGKEFLSTQKIDSFSAVIVDENFFEDAKNSGVINEIQLELIKQFTKNPDEYGKNFLIKYPEFLKKSINSNDKSIKSKAERCIKENPYKIDFNKIF